MGTRTEYAPGTFSWIDLSTTDPEGAKAFYTDLFGWEPEDADTGDGGIYTMFRLGGSAVAGASLQQEAERETGVAPHWNNYVTVADVGQIVERVDELGGSVLLPAFDVLESGRMAAIADPTGAALMLWEPRASIGAERVNDPGCLTWNELSTTDPARAREFYGELFGWEAEKLDTGDGPDYWAINHEGAAAGRNGGIRELAPEQENVPPHWMPYFTVESAADAVAKASELGGASHFGPMDLPNGRIAVLGDPQGAIFAIFEGEVDD